MKRLLAAAVAALVASPLAADAPMNWLDPDGPVAQVQKDVFMVTFWVDLGIFLVVGGMLLYAVIAFRARPDDDGSPPEQVEGNLRLEVSLMAVSAVLLVIIIVPNVRGIFYSAAPPADAVTMDVNVIGHQWWWEVEYPALGVKTANEIAIPTGTAVVFHLSSADVIHSFWVPRLAGKMDLIPGRVNEMWLQADRPGVYWGQCAELCGVSHANMRFRVVAMAPDDFDRWVEEQSAAAATPAPGTLAAAGAEAFVQRGCIACHTVRGLTGAVGIIGPDLTHVGSRLTLAAGIVDNDDAAMAKWISDPEAIKPGNIMSAQGPMYMDPANALSQADVEALVAYLRGLE